MADLRPKTPEELADALGQAAAGRRTITVAGAASKRRMAGPVEPSDVNISTVCLNRVLQYEPHDLTISVQAGLPYAELTRLLAENHQMIPLDPPFAASATVGGVIASNSSGPRRRLYGTARDLVIGMTFATVEGKLVQSGGMVVKNVAGLDMAKLMIGSFGTLAALAVINFKVQPLPDAERSFVLSFPTLADAIAARDAVLKSVLQPAALDLLNPAAAGHLGAKGFALAIQGGGTPAAIDRYERECAALGEGVALDGAQQAALWRYVANFTEQYLDTNPDGAVVRVSCTLKELAAVVETVEGPAIARAGSGVCYAYFPKAEAAGGWARQCAARGWKTVVEFAPEAEKSRLELWPSPGGDLEIMHRIKAMFDPERLLNRGRLYSRI